MGRATELRRTAVFAVTAVMAGFGLTGVASAQSLTNMNGWGGTSTTTVQNKCSITNVNDVSASNSNSQVATSGDAIVTGNGTSDSWGGWDQLSPENAQGQGMSYSAWYNGVVNWVSNRADGAGWMSNGGGNVLPPNGGGWDSYDPMLWQSSNLKFGDWYNSVQHYLNQNSPMWLLGWPASDTGSGAGSATTGNATNNNSANFSININNAASAKYGTPTCGHSTSVASCPCGNGGKGGGVVAGNASNLTQQTSQNKPTGNSGGQGGYTPEQSGYSESSASPAYGKGGAPSGQESPSTESSESTGQTGSNGGGSTYCPPASTPEATTGTVAARTTVTNTNVVSVSNVNTQTAVTGNAVVANNGPSGMGGSGSSSNGNGTNMGASLDD